MSTQYASLDLVVSYDTTSYTYVLYLGDESVGRPTDRIYRGRVDGAIKGVPTDSVFTFMWEELPGQHEEIAQLARSHPEHQIHVGDATVRRDTGEIQVAQIYSAFRVGPKKPVADAITG